MDSRFWKVILALIFPPLAVLDKGCGTALVVGLLTFPLWLPGFLAALFIIFTDTDERRSRRRFVEIPVVERDLDADADEEKRKGAYIRLADGAVAEVVEDDHAPLSGFKNQQ